MEAAHLQLDQATRSMRTTAAQQKSALSGEQQKLAEVATKLIAAEAELTKAKADLAASRAAASKHPQVRPRLTSPLPFLAPPSGPPPSLSLSLLFSQELLEAKKQARQARSDLEALQEEQRAKQQEADALAAHSKKVAALVKVSKGKGAGQFGAC